MYFDDPDDDALTYTAVSDTEAVATVSKPDANSMITITAVGAGSADITVTATDEKSDPVSLTFSVMVAAIPPANQSPTKSAIPDQSIVFGSTATLTLSMYFDDPDDDALTYTAVSDTEAVATVSKPDANSMITITAVGAGSADITVTATDEKSDPVSLTFSVMVAAIPPANQSPTKSAIPDQSIVFGSTATLTLSMYFDDPDDDALTYTAVSDTEAVATVSKPDANSMITITAVRVGDATITVTAADADNDPVAATFEVTVTAAPNMAPTVKGDGLPPIKMVFDADESVVEVRDIDLSEYFEDPESYPLVFSASLTADPAGAAEIVEATGMSKPDGTDFDKLLSIDLKATGTATVTVTARDNADLKASDTFTITIGASNTIPEIVSGSDIADYDQVASFTETDGEKRRLVIGDSVKPIDDEAIHDYFVDADFIESTEVEGVGEMLTFEVKFYPPGTTREQVIDADNTADGNQPAGELEDGKEGVTATPSRSTWNGLEATKFTLALTAVRGTEVGDNNDDTDSGHVVAIIATDQYGGKVAHAFAVRVNHDPVNQGSQEEDPKKLSTASADFDDLVFDSDKDDIDMDDHVTIVDLNDYFSDKDGEADIASCRIVGKTGDAAEFKTPEDASGDSIALRILPKKRGTSSVSVECTDTFERKSGSDTLTVVVASSIHESRH
jgi:hypothetical protein